MKVFIIQGRYIIKIVLILLLVCTGIFVFKPYVNEVVSSISENKKLPIYCVQTEKPQIAISFDAAWGADDTDDLLAILKKHNIKTTFFLVGDWVRKYPEEVKRIAAAGHDIGNHSNKHPYMTKLSEEKMREEIMAAHEEMKNLTGIEMDLFRPPYGDYNSKVIEVGEQCGYYSIQWDVDSLDWKEYGREALVDKVLHHKNLGNGSIVLFHNNAKYTKDALDEILTGLEGQGYEIIPISQLIYRDSFRMDHTGRQIPEEEKSLAQE